MCICMCQVKLSMSLVFVFKLWVSLTKRSKFIECFFYVFESVKIYIYIIGRPHNVLVVLNRISRRVHCPTVCLYEHIDLSYYTSWNYQIYAVGCISCPARDEFKYWLPSLPPIHFTNLFLQYPTWRGYCSSRSTFAPESALMNAARRGAVVAT